MVLHFARQLSGLYPRQQDDLCGGCKCTHTTHIKHDSQKSLTGKTEGDIRRTLSAIKGEDRKRMLLGTPASHLAQPSNLLAVPGTL